MLISVFAATSGIGAFVIFAALMSESECCGLAARSRRSNAWSDRSGSSWRRPVVRWDRRDGRVARTRREADRCSDGRAVASVRKRPDTGQSAGVEGGLEHGVRRHDGGVAGTARAPMPLVLAARRIWASVGIPRHTSERPPATRPQRRDNGTGRRRLRVGRRGPLVSGFLRPSRVARPRSAVVRCRWRRRGARAGAPFAPASLTRRDAREGLRGLSRTSGIW